MIRPGTHAPRSTAIGSDVFGLGILPQIQQFLIKNFSAFVYAYLRRDKTCTDNEHIHGTLS